MSSLRSFGLMAVAVVIGLLPMVARAEEADTALARIRQNKAVTFILL